MCLAIEQIKQRCYAEGFAEGYAEFFAKGEYKVLVGDVEGVMEEFGFSPAEALNIIGTSASPETRRKVAEYFGIQNLDQVVNVQTENAQRT